MNKTLPPFWLGLGLVILTLMAYRQVSQNDFINFDDPRYVQNNPLLIHGLSLKGIKKSFTTIQAGYWIPLTWISYQIDYEISQATAPKELDPKLKGLRPSVYHRTNLLWHGATVLLLFVTVRRLTQSTEVGFLVAALFAAHPIQVESVAWVTERKDVLSTFFWVLTTWFYARYTEKPSIQRYLPMVLGLVLGFMAKPMLVTLPCTLLLLDVWPLRRWTPFEKSESIALWKLILEKLPLFALAFGAGILTIFTQEKGDAVRTLEQISAIARLENGFVAYVIYLRKLVWPSDLGVFYPHPFESLPTWKVAMAAGLLGVVTLFALWQMKRRPWFLVGWLWFFGVLFPVSGVMQAGWQSMADRFAYVPSIGIFLIVGQCLAPFLTGSRRQRVVSWGLVTVVLATLTVMTSLQVRHWKNSHTLFQHTLSVTRSNFVTHQCLAAASLDGPDQDLKAAVHHAEMAIRDKPDHFLGHYFLGVARRKQKRYPEAIEHWKTSLKHHKGHLPTYAHLAEVTAIQRQLPEAERWVQMGWKLNRSSPRLAYSQGVIHEMRGEYPQALKWYQQAVRWNPHVPFYEKELARLQKAWRGR